MTNRRGSLQNELQAVRIAIIDAEHDIAQWHSKRQRSSLAKLDGASRLRHLEARLDGLQQRRTVLIEMITKGRGESLPNGSPSGEPEK
ncbi:MAG: hypothetical protein WBL20_15380 [Sphingobium sp.]|jgi:hypothetical protein|uniref:hypothetical protein n=1 Tax=Sphingobium sp. TaxID=1912891 RepID=UPI003BB00663